MHGDRFLRRNSFFVSETVQISVRRALRRVHNLCVKIAQSMLIIVVVEWEQNNKKCYQKCKFITRCHYVSTVIEVELLEDEQTTKWLDWAYLSYQRSANDTAIEYDTYIEQSRSFCYYWYCQTSTKSEMHRICFVVVSTNRKYASCACSQ